MDAKENYRKVISNPWSWEYTAGNLFSAANDLRELYLTRFEARRKYMRYALEAGLGNEPSSFEAAFKAGIEPSISQDFPRTDYGKTIFYKPIGENLKCYVYILPVYMMLMGMAVENLAKGIKVARMLKEDNTIVSRATLREFEIYGHTTPDLIKSMGISLNDNEEKYLDDINEHLEWAGRYSAPAKEDKIVLPETVMDMTPAEFEEEKGFEILTGLYKRLMDIFDMEVMDPFLKGLRYYHIRLH